MNKLQLLHEHISAISVHYISDCDSQSQSRLHTPIILSQV